MSSYFFVAKKRLGAIDDEGCRTEQFPKEVVETIEEAFSTGTARIVVGNRSEHGIIETGKVVRTDIDGSTVTIGSLKRFPPLPFRDVRHLQSIDGETLATAAFGALTSDTANSLYYLLGRNASEIQGNQLPVGGLVGIPVAEPNLGLDSFYPPPLTQDTDPSDALNLLCEEVQASLGKIMLVGVQGSRRYNVDVDESDYDFYIVYQPTLRADLSYHVAPSTFSSPEGSAFDFVIVDVREYAKLLCQGDPKTVETLFLPVLAVDTDRDQVHQFEWDVQHNKEPIYYMAPEIKELQSIRSLFLTQELAHKYYRDATGRRGFTYWLDRFPSDESNGYKRIAICFRMLLLAYEVASGDTYTPWFNTLGHREPAALMRGPDEPEVKKEEETREDPWQQISPTTPITTEIAASLHCREALIKIRVGAVPLDIIRGVVEQLEKAMKEHVELSLLSSSCEGAWVMQSWLYNLQVSQELRAPVLTSRLPQLWSPAAVEAQARVDSVVDSRNFNAERRADHCTLGACSWSPLLPPHVVTDAARKLIDLWRSAGTHVVFAAVDPGLGVWGGPPSLHVVWQRSAGQQFKAPLCSAFLKTVGADSSQSTLSSYSTPEARRHRRDIQMLMGPQVKDGFVECDGVWLEVCATDLNTYMRSLRSGRATAVILTEPMFLDNAKAEGRVVAESVMWKRITAQRYLSAPYVKNLIGQASGYLHQLQTLAVRNPDVLPSGRSMSIRDRRKIILQCGLSLARITRLLLEISDLDLQEPWILREKDMIPLQYSSVISVIDKLTMVMNHICAWARVPHPLKKKKQKKAKSPEESSPMELQEQEKEWESKVKEAEVPPPLSIVPAIVYIDEEPSYMPPSPWAEKKRGFLDALPATPDIPFDFHNDLAAAFTEGVEKEDLPQPSASVAELLDSLNLPSAIKPQNVLYVLRSGSAMYGLSTPKSDVDYSILYLERGRAFLANTPRTRFSDHVEGNFGMDKSGEVEYSAVEAGTFLEDVMKGNPRNIEPWFLDPSDESWVYLSPVWAEVLKHKSLFITQRAIGQYWGQIMDRLKRCKSADAMSAKAKLLYHAFHKLFELQRILQGKPPVVRLPANERDFIMGFRSSSDPEELDSIEKKAHEMVSQLEELHRGRQAEGTLPTREVDVKVMVNLILDLRFRFRQLKQHR